MEALSASSMCALASSLQATGVGTTAARLAFTGDGSLLVVLSGGGPTISIRDAKTLELVVPPILPEGFRGTHLGSYYRSAHFALTPDNRSLITASDAGELAWWDLKTGRKTRSVEIAADYHALALSADGLIAAVGIEGGIQLVDVPTGEVRTSTAGFAGSPNWLRFSPDGTSVVSANIDGSVTRWDARSASPVETLRGHANSVQQLVFSRDGKTLYTVSSDGTAIAWGIPGGRSVKRTFRFTHDRLFDGAYDRHPGRFSPDGRLIAVGLKERGIGLWNARTLTPTASLVETGGEVKTLAFAPDGRTLAAVTSNGQATIWDVATLSLRHGPLPAYGGLLAGVAFSADGSTFATSGSAGVQLRNTRTGAPLGGGFGYSSGGADVALSADGALAALAVTGVGSPHAEVWDVETRSRVATFRGGADGDSLSVALSADGRAARARRL